MNNQPLVTVVIPTWNRLPLIEDAVRSVLAQTYQRWELIVVDDGSTDGTSARLGALKDFRIRVLEMPRIGHIGQLRNRGAAAGSGELIAFLDSDDVWLPRKLALQVAALQTSNAGWCYCGFELMDAAGKTIPLRAGKFRPLSGRIVRELLTAEASVAVQTVLVKRTLFDSVGCFSEHPRLNLREDHELHLRLALHSDAVAVPDLAVRIREHDSRTTNEAADAHERTARVYEFFLANKPTADLARVARQLRTRHLSDAGAQTLASGKPARAAILFGYSLAYGAEPSHWARAVAHGLRKAFARKSQGQP